MTRTGRMQPHTRARAGESMVMVIVMLLVFFILGGSVLTAASSTSAAASARIIERQGYYYARSALDVLDESLRNGELGRAFRSAAMGKLVAAGKDVTAVSFASKENGKATPLLEFTPAFEGALSEVGFDGTVVIACDGRAAAVQGAGSAITEASIQMRKVDMSFTLLYRGIPTRMHVQYRCTCNVKGYSADTQEGTWTSTWNIQQVG